MASKQSISTVNPFPVPLSLTPPGLNYNKGGNNFVTLHAAVPQNVSMFVRKATFTMEHVNITIYLCCFMWYALHVVRKGNIILTGLSISKYDCNIHSGCEGGHRNYPGSFNSYIWHNHRCLYNTNLSIIIENEDDSDT